MALNVLFKAGELLGGRAAADQQQSRIFLGLFAPAAGRALGRLRPLGLGGLIGGALSAFVNFALNLYFIPRYGMMAAAWTTVAAEAVALAPLVCMWDRRVKLWRMDKTND